MENEKIARPWQPPNMPEGVAELIENDQLLQDLDIRGLASADSAEFKTAVDKLTRRLREQYSAGFTAGVKKTSSIIAACGIFGAGLALILISVFG